MSSRQSVDISKIHPNKPPFSFVDKVTDYCPNEYIKGVKYLTQNDWFFSAHWPGNPVMPGSLQLEAMTQLAGILLFLTEAQNEQFISLRKISDAAFYKAIKPGDVLEISNTIIKSNHGIVDFKGVAFIGDAKAFSCNFTLVCPNALKKFYGK